MENFHGQREKRSSSRIERQVNLLHELQESNEKDNLDSRYARLMSELASICSDRSNLITLESITHLANNGRAEPIKLEQEVEVVSEGSTLKSTINKSDDLLSADAARRQRVEELTRFFIEAKSDIEFVLGGGRDRRQPNSDALDRDDDAENETCDDDDEEKNGTGDDNASSSAANDPEKELVQLHSKLLKESVDHRIYNGLLAQLRESDPALYGVLLCNPLLTGVDLKKEKKKKKRRKEKEVRKEKTSQSSSQNSNINASPGMVVPDFTADPLASDDVALHISRFIAKAIASGSTQAMLIAIAIMMSWLNSSSEETLMTLKFPLATHLRVLRGEKPPSCKKDNAKDCTPELPSEKALPSTTLPSSGSRGGIKSLTAIVAENSEALQSESSEISMGMELEADSDSLAKLRARLDRFGHNSLESDDNDDAGQDNEDRQGNAHERVNFGGEGVDEDALMARAIALSLSPDANLRKLESNANSNPGDSIMESSMEEEKTADPLPRPEKFSAMEFLSLGPFLLPIDEVHVNGMTVAMCLISKLNDGFTHYIQSSRNGVIPSSHFVQPQPLTFMLLNHILTELMNVSTIPHEIKSHSLSSTLQLLNSISKLTMFRVLEAHLFHIEVTSLAPASVGLGHNSKLRETSETYEGQSGNPLLDSLKSIVLQQIDNDSAEEEYQTLDTSIDFVAKILHSTDFTPQDIENAVTVYRSCLREQATAAWVRGIAHFYHTQLDRHKLLRSKLTDCLRMCSTNMIEDKWCFYQLDLLCARLALPDLSLGFVPSSFTAVQSIAQDDSDNNAAQAELDLKPIDDGTLQNAASKTGKTQTTWSPATIRTSVNIGSLSPRCLYHYIIENAPDNITESLGVSLSTVDEIESAEMLIVAYEQMWDSNHALETEALECIERLPLLFNLLSESVVLTNWLGFSFIDDYTLLHAPLLPILESRNKLEVATLNARVLLMRSLQDHMIQRISGCRGDEPPALEFDTSRCAETMTLADSNQTAKQYTAKQWGTVMATTGCPPNTGIHEWAVRLDRCEKGHIFLGVCTRDASVATYVGGDRQGWGLIGTRALWHNRSKVRGDYGEGFNTGSIVRVRLNTDSGALSFGVDESDWGIAFDGLTQHGTLYPAIGLYQRDDQVTILPVQSRNDSIGATGPEEHRQAGILVPAALKPLLGHMGNMLESCCRLFGTLKSSEMESEAKLLCLLQNPFLFPLVAPLISSLSLVKDYHGLSSTLALQLIPSFIKLIESIEAFTINNHDNDASTVKPQDLCIDVTGEWELKSVAAGNIPAQQYHVALTQREDGSVIGRNSGGLTSVNISGIVRGTRVCLLESWRQGGTCLVEGRLRSDGRTFQGSYEDAKSHTSGSIIGKKVETGDGNVSLNSQWFTPSKNDLFILELLFSNLIGRFCQALCYPGSDDILVEMLTHSYVVGNDEMNAATEVDESDSLKDKISNSSNEKLDTWINSPLLSGGLPQPVVQRHLNQMLTRFKDISAKPINADRYSYLDNASKSWLSSVVPRTMKSIDEIGDSNTTFINSPFFQDLINARGDAVVIDNWISRHVGETPFVRLGGEPIRIARRTVCAAMIWHAGFLNAFTNRLEGQSPGRDLVESEVRPHDCLMHIWRASHRVIEWAVRMKNSSGSTYAIVGGQVIRRAQFLLSIMPNIKALSAAGSISLFTSGPNYFNNVSATKSSTHDYAEKVCNETLVHVARFLETPLRITALRNLMLQRSAKAFLRSVGLMSYWSILRDPTGSQITGGRDSSRGGIQSLAAQSSVFAWLHPICKSGRGQKPYNTGVELGDPSTSSVSTSDNFSYTGWIDYSYYLSGLEGCGQDLKRDVRDAFEALYGHLCAALSKATWANDVDQQLVILQAWGIIIRPEDHVFLSRIGIFRVLQTVLDDARTTLTRADEYSSKSIVLDERNLLIEAKRKVVQAALKVVHLLAAQVAHADDSTEDLAPSSVQLEGSQSASFSLNAIPLMRKPSGPETLGKSVFRMLYTELKNALSLLQSSNELNGHKDKNEVAMITDSAEPEANGDSSSFQDDTSEYCYQICSLLFSVSGSAVCRAHLSSNSWLRLLLALLDVDSMDIQRRILKLLRRLLPSLDPNNIRANVNDTQIMDADSDDELEEEESDTHASELIDFFIKKIWLLCPPSVAEFHLRKANDSTETNSGMDRMLTANRETSVTNGGVGNIAAEVILLLRSLYDSPAWAGCLNHAVECALADIPLVCLTEKWCRKESVVDSDVDMEAQTDDLPSLSQWHLQTSKYLNAMSFLCVLDGHVEGFHIGSTVKIIPRSGSSLQEFAVRGALGTIVAYEPEKSVAEVLIRGVRSIENNNTGASSSILTPSPSTIPNRPVRVPIDDLYLVPEVELNPVVFNDKVLDMLLVKKFKFFLDEVSKSLDEITITDSRKDVDSADDSDDDDDDMSNDGSASPSGIESELNGTSGGNESESESLSNVLGVHSSSHSTEIHVEDDTRQPHINIEPIDILTEMENESRMHRLFLSLHGLRSAASLLKSKRCAATLINGVGSEGLALLFKVAISETTATNTFGGDITILEDSWSYLRARWFALRSSVVSPPTTAGHKTSHRATSENEEGSGSGIPEPMIQQMMEMGFPKEWCEVALTRCAQNVEAAINFCFEHSGDMERLLAQYKAARDGGFHASKTVKDDFDSINPLLEQLSEMGFPANWCRKALAANRNNVDAALTWILSNGEALEAEDRRDEESKTVGTNADTSDSTAGATSVSSVPPNPLRSVSGQASIGEVDMMVEGLAGGGFASVGAPDCMVSKGRWFYEATLHTNGCIQIGWADMAFSGAADRGDGVGDGAHSWAYDGWRQQKWHGQSSPWGSKWKQGDIVGCGVDMDAGTIIFSLNGKMKSVNMGIAFRAVKYTRGLYPCASFNRRERLQFNLGGSPFKYPLPPGFRPILEVLHDDIQRAEKPLRGFAVVGVREDCFEENMGDDNYPPESRYFPRDSQPTVIRGSSSHSRHSLILNTSRSEILAELKSIPNDRVYMELLLVTRSLAISHVKRALLTLLARWPVEEVGPFSMQSCIPNTKPPGRSVLVEFVKLLACINNCGNTIANSLTTATSLSDADVIQLLDSGVSGRQSLRLLYGAMQSALHCAFESSIQENRIQSASLPDDILNCIGDEVSAASKRIYGSVPWDASDLAIMASLLQIAAEADVVSASPSDQLAEPIPESHPNLFLAEWLTHILIESISAYEVQFPQEMEEKIFYRLLQAWVGSLKSPSVCVKERGAVVLAGILQRFLIRTQVDPVTGVCIDPIQRKVIESALMLLPQERLAALTQERLLKEYSHVPVCSKYLQALVELLSVVALLLHMLGEPARKLLAVEENSQSDRVNAYKQIVADLMPIDLAEYEEMLHRKKVREEEAVKKMQEECNSNNMEDKYTGIDNENLQESTNKDVNEQYSSSAETHEVKLQEGFQEEDSTGMHMDVDNSDHDDSQTDIPYSAIADMVAEDTDIVAAAAAIASARSRRRDKLKEGSSLSATKSDASNQEYEFIVPELELPVDTSTLDQQQLSSLESGKCGLLSLKPFEWRYGHDLGILGDTNTKIFSGMISQHMLLPEVKDSDIPPLDVGCRVIRGPSWKWRDQDGGDGSVGTIENVSPWSGVEGEGMSVRWANDSLYTYRWGADGKYDLIHVEVNEEGKIVKKYPTPSAKAVNRHNGPFGSELHLGVLLHLFEEGRELFGILEFPDYGAAVRVTGNAMPNGKFILQELQLCRGNPDMGWTLRFGREQWQPGTKYTLTAEQSDKGYLVLRGDYSHPAVKNNSIENITGVISLSTKYLFTMDPHCHFSTLGISANGLTVTCSSGESRNLALGTVGFSTGVHYWEVRIEQAEYGSVFIGVCEKAGPPGSQAALASRLNRWHGWGFVNFRATYHNSTERIYGDHFNAGDIVGVRLDMEQGKLSFFLDGIKFGEHVITDLGVAFENVKGDPERTSRTLYPCIGMRKMGDRVSLNEKWISVPGISPHHLLQDFLDVSHCLHVWYKFSRQPSIQSNDAQLPDALLKTSWKEWRRWYENRWQRYPSRPRGVCIDVDTYASSSLEVCRAAGLAAPFVPGDRVRIISECGRELTSPEEAIIIGVYRGSLWYRIETQGNEGADEGRSWVWYWTASELAELILIRRNGQDMTTMDCNSTDISYHLLQDKPYTPASAIETEALQSFETYKLLATQGHTGKSDMQLVERLNAFASAMGIDIVNIKVCDMQAVDEAKGVNPSKLSVLNDLESSLTLAALGGVKLRARFAVLRVLNSKILRALPMIAIQSPVLQNTNILDTMAVTLDSTFSVPQLSSQFISTGHKLRALRWLVFTGTKRAYWDSVLRATMTSTPLPSDEYEDPREIRVIRINRIQAQPTKLSLLPQPGDRLRRSVFGQLYRELRGWNDSFFRRSYCGKGHGGQRRAFKVKFLGEGVNDYGGPYRAVFEQVVDELQMDNIELSKGEFALLPLLIPCPNRRSGTGANQDKFLLNPTCGASPGQNNNGSVALALHLFLGKLIGTAVRHGLQMGLDLPSVVWRPLCALEVNRAHLESIDVVAVNHLKSIENYNDMDVTMREIVEQLTFTTLLSDGTEWPLIPDGDKVHVTKETRQSYAQLVERTRLSESKQQLAALREGLAAVLPMELAPLFTAKEFEILICGRRDVDVDLLQQCTEYGDGIDATMPHIQWFWEVLREFPSADKTSFLRFVWARSRMPNSAKDFPMNFKIQCAQEAGAGSTPDFYLPHAQTCFFALRLPKYTSKDILRQKLLYAIQNSPNMDADVRLHNAEGWADA